MIKGRGRLPDCDVCLVSPNEQFYYTEMIGGYLEGDYAEAEICLDLPALCKMAKISFQRGVVSAINPLKKTVRLKDGAELSYDWLSIDIGAPLAELDVPGVEEHSVQLTPSSNMIELRQRLEEFNSDAAPVVIVGAGRPGGGAGPGFTAIFSSPTSRSRDNGHRQGEFAFARVPATSAATDGYDNGEKWNYVG